MKEIAPGIFHWTATHPDIRMLVSSYYFEPAGIVIDPLEPEDGMGFFDDLDTAPQQVVLTSGLHWRHSDRFRDRFGATIRVVQEGIERWGGDSDRQAEPFTFGDEVAPGVVAHEIGCIAPDDTALIIDNGPGAVVLADALMGYDGLLAFVPDSLMDDPEDEKRALIDRFRGLLTKDFDALLLAHGDPIGTGGHAALQKFVSRPQV
jgi:glyoxylase-like metal-dependent hydrolase (beta-lactamase superfamily II)